MNETKKKSFALGYSYVFESWLSWLFYGLLISTGLSTFVLNFSGVSGVPTSTLYSVNTIGGFISVIGCFVCSMILKKKGIRFVTAFSYIVSAIGVFVVGHGNSIGAYLIFSVLTQFFYQGYCYGSSNALVANWFPRKRGTMLGIATTGLMFSSFTGVMFMTKMTPVIGWGNVCNIIGAVVLVLGVICWFWIKDTPESCGMLPDNMPISEDERAALATPVKEIWTVKQILTHKDSLLYILGLGCLNMVGTGTLTMVVPLMMENGYSQVNAVWIMSLSGVFAIFGSIILGIVDDKKGSKFATVILSVFYAAGPFLMFVFSMMDFVPGVIVATVATSCAGGALANLGGSLVVNMYGRVGYNQAWRYLNTGAQLLKACCYLAIGLVTATLGKYAYVSVVWAIVGVFGLIFICLGKFDRRKDPINN